MKLKKLTGSLLVATISVLALAACKENASAKDADANSQAKVSISTAQPSTPEEELSYSLGNIIGQRIKSDFENINSAQIVKGLDDALAGNKPALTKEKMQSLIEKSQQEQMKKAQKKIKEETKANLKRSETLLKENSGKAGVQVTASGLQYKDITEKLTTQDKKELIDYLKEKPVMDKKSTPDGNSTVTVSYIGTFTDKDGKTRTFDASEKRKEPAVFTVSQVIKGWQEGLKLMHVGQSFEFFIPPKLAYGENGIPGVIPPNTMLNFKVTLLKVENGSLNKTVRKKKKEKPKVKSSQDASKKGKNSAENSDTAEHGK